MPRRDRSIVEEKTDHAHVPSGRLLFCEIYSSGLYMLRKCKICGEIYEDKPTPEESMWWGEVMKNRFVYD